MKNIIKIFVSDARRLATNVVAMVVIMGLAVIPSLYAWFNILSNWDPYGEKSTANLHVVVASCDEGVEIEGIKLNIGEMVIDNLKANKTIGWVFVDTEEEAVDGVYSGDYYAGLVIDDTFSKDMISFLGGDIQHPKITYYENEKKNAIAPKITGKVKTTVQQEINGAFVSTMAKTIMEASESIVTTDDKGKLTSAAYGRLESLNSDLSSYITIVDSYIAIMDSASSLMDASNEMGNQLESMMQAGRTMANGADLSADTAADAVQTTSDMITRTMESVEAQLVALTESMKMIQEGVKVADEGVNKTVKASKEALQEIQKQFNEAVSKPSVPQTDEIKNRVQTVNQDFDKLIADLDSIQAASNQMNADATQIASQLETDLSACQKSVAETNQAYKDTVEPQLRETMRTIQQSIYEIQEILNYSSDSIKDVAGALGSYPDMMSMGKERLVESRNGAMEMQQKLQTLMNDLKGLEGNEQYNLLLKLIESDPELVAEFISNPVKLDQTPIYEMKNNGSATAPFYIVLSIWFGSLILVAIMHTEIKHKEAFPGVNNAQCFFGRYIVFFLIGQIQTLITVLGSLLYVGIQCEHPLLFWIASSFTSFTFTLFMYALSYAFGNVGEALAVVLMVIQVAGSGGTFPVEVLPKVFQFMYEYMPFAHAMNALRETIAGMHNYDYWIYLAGMLTYIVAALVFGLLLSIPCKKLNHKIEESKERTDLLL